MSLAHMFRVSVEDGGAVISPDTDYCRDLHFLGASSGTVAIPGTDVMSVYLRPEEGVDVLMALAGTEVRYQHGKQLKNELFAVWIRGTWKDNKFVVDLYREAVPMRWARIYPDHIEVPIGGDTFSSAEKVKPGQRNVDGNTLCRYLNGDLVGVDVSEEAEEAEVEQTEVRRLELSLSVKETSLSLAQEENDRLYAERNEARHKVEELEVELMRARCSLGSIRDFLERGVRWGKRHAALERIQRDANYFYNQTGR